MLQHHLMDAFFDSLVSMVYGLCILDFPFQVKPLMHIIESLQMFPIKMQLRKQRMQTGMRYTLFKECSGQNMGF